MRYDRPATDRTQAARRSVSVTCERRRLHRGRIPRARFIERPACSRSAYVYILSIRSRKLSQPQRRGYRERERERVSKERERISDRTGILLSLPRTCRFRVAISQVETNPRVTSLMRPRIFQQVATPPDPEDRAPIHTRTIRSHIWNNPLSSRWPR